MNKLIIDNRTELTDLEAITLVGKVINQGRISNNGKQYCYENEFYELKNGTVNKYKRES